MILFSPMLMDMRMVLAGMIFKKGRIERILSSLCWISLESLDQLHGLTRIFLPFLKVGAVFRGSI